MSILNIISHENSRKVPQERVTPAEAPLIGQYEGIVDRSVTAIYRYVVRIPLVGAVEQSAVSSSSEVVAEPDAGFEVTASAPQAGHTPAEVPLYAGHANAEAIQRAYENLAAAWKGSENV